MTTSIRTRKAFVSVAKPDAAVARQLVERLRQHGVHISVREAILRVQMKVQKPSPTTHTAPPSQPPAVPSR